MRWTPQTSAEKELRKASYGKENTRARRRACLPLPLERNPTKLKDKVFRPHHTVLNRRTLPRELLDQFYPWLVREQRPNQSSNADCHIREEGASMLGHKWRTSIRCATSKPHKRTEVDGRPAKECAIIVPSAQPKDALPIEAAGSFSLCASPSHPSCPHTSRPDSENGNYFVTPLSPRRRGPLSQTPQTPPHPARQSRRNGRASGPAPTAVLPSRGSSLEPWKLRRRRFRRKRHHRDRSRQALGSAVLMVVRGRWRAVATPGEARARPTAVARIAGVLTAHCETRAEGGKRDQAREGGWSKNGGKGKPGD